ncbi:bifunctional molybdenum cofactor biosynthesis protein MoaC/MoaB [Algoriphagus terrigena]|uniref:bifunctional molybdenum cofactor biosynthesis protein MoaC/MoaB n=1 Tax=Algoriphagus terrigena TaxID=344884 RepID=UPI000423B451|nr:bifunctional molybdenum cofactor biosynthesis protein MoaC/MoaB [Algoriphagus terrigena]
MEDISVNISSLREACAEAVICVSKSETIQAILDGRVPKGNVFEMAKVAGLFAVKNTHLSLPNSYPVPIEFTCIEYRIADLEIHVLVKVRSVCKSNLEMEAMHGASITALTIYDMLKPIDKGIHIQQIKILEEPNEQSRPQPGHPFNAAVVVCSNAVSKGVKPDSAGQLILKKLLSQGPEITSYSIIPDDLDQIRALAKELSTNNQLVIFSGGTGLSKTDVTTEALESLLDRRIPGIEEAIRRYGQSLTPYAMFSRSLVGTIGDCLVLALPGSTRGAGESMDAIFPHILHAFRL